MNTSTESNSNKIFKNAQGETLREMYDRLNFEFSDYGRMMPFNDWLDWLVFTDKLSAAVAQANKETH
jgi:hypothetical protein